MTTHAGTGTFAPGRRPLEDFLLGLDIRIDGARPHDVRIIDDAFWTKALPWGIKGILDAYVDGWWECDRLDEMTTRVLSAGKTIQAWRALPLAAQHLVWRALNHQTRRRSLEIRRHYDLGDDLFAAMLDRRMAYSCAYWKDAATLDEAQEAKLDLVCRKVNLRPGMRVLDIGCGWGSFVGFAAERYDVSAVGVTISEDQVCLGRERTAGLPVDIRLQDYRDLPDERFDAIVSIGMFEHVGYKNYRTYMETVRRCLKPDGLFLLHTIGGPTSKVSCNPWIAENIFPNSMLPSARQIAQATEGLFVLEDWHSFGADYDRTLMAWHRNFEAAWPALEASYGDRFRRMWRCYLLVCAGSFRARDNQLWQIVLSPNGVRGGYQSVR